VRKISLVTFALIALTGLASAQVPKGNIFAGYSYASADLGAGKRTSLNGWNASLEGKVFPFVGIVADVSGHYGSQDFGTVSGDGRLLTAMFGPRVSVRVGKLRPFAEALFGVSRLRVEFPTFTDGDTSFASAYGGGVDYHLLPFFAWRVEADALRTSFSNGTQNNFRVSTGVVFSF
jgi:Outer membrane protein beta-barrel domain